MTQELSDSQVRAFCKARMLRNIETCSCNKWVLHFDDGESLELWAETSFPGIPHLEAYRHERPK